MIADATASGSFGLDHLVLAIADRDLARLLGLGNLAHEIDVQESVLEGRALDLDVVGKLEHALEGAGGDALVEHVAAVLVGLRLFLAFDRQRVFLRLDRKLVLAEAGYRDGDAVRILAGALDVIGRVARSALEAVEHGEQPVKADGGTIEGSKIESSHGITSLLSEMRLIRPKGRTGCFLRSPKGLRNAHMGVDPGQRKGVKLLGLRQCSLKFPPACPAPAASRPVRIEESRRPAIRRARELPARS